MTDKMEPKSLTTREEFARLAARVGPEEGWTDTPEYILNENNFAFRVMGRWFAYNKSGTLVDLD
jgi:16S rRNA U1498 N3-methylase RsmE